MSFEQSQEVINDYEKLLESDEEYNVTIHAGENENVEEIHGHSTILRIRSRYFREAFTNELTEKKDGKFIFVIPNITPQIFKIILRFIYCGKIDFEKLQGPDILKLLIAVDELKVQTLIPYINEYLIKHQRDFLQKNPIEVLEVVYQVNQRDELFSDLWNHCLEEICTKSDILFKPDEFANLNASLVELLLKRDDLYLDEIDIWESLIKWCLAQHVYISQDPMQWNNEDITTMERTIHRFIPLIRFYNISSADFITRVYPFKKILPEDLINNILVFHMASKEKLNVDIQSPRKPKRFYDSVIINKKHFAIISSWIEKQCHSYYNENDIPYIFNLLYRASRDGDTAADFHNKCDNKGATLLVIKISNSEQIVGGYNPLIWDSSNTWKSTYDSFLFSFTNKNNLQSAKVGYSNADQYSIGCDSRNGAKFGGNSDLFYNNNGMWYGYTNTTTNSYPNIGIPTNFKADDYEVFQVIECDSYIIKKRIMRIVYFVILFTIFVIYNLR
ncbi:hypothetical protein RclHR1_08210007 [Rhizophagus clarus]|uniref:BTB/POZ domain-containing protein n=1 Tax=Rhizophagus clarus TaxID=94130 RepID=A0A2Z6SFD2_9GLOM|nr:hypothetical protein RclHR1_08210007 [Rhizophagus clarus]GES85008.1 BTB/POZ domain-containing protein [Rhizophagus clarus]